MIKTCKCFHNLNLNLYTSPFVFYGNGTGVSCCCKYIPPGFISFEIHIDFNLFLVGQTCKRTKTTIANCNDIKICINRQVVL